MTDYQRGYNDGLAVLAIDKLCFAVIALESAANWLKRAESNKALVEGDYKRIAAFFVQGTDALESIANTYAPEEMRDG